MRESAKRRLPARILGWIFVVAVYAAGLVYAANLGTPLADPAPSAAVVASDPAPAPESPLVTLALAGAGAAGFAAWRATRLGRRRIRVVAVRPTTTEASIATR